MEGTEYGCSLVFSKAKSRKEREREREMNDSTFLAAEKYTRHAWACPQLSTALNMCRAAHCSTVVLLPFTSITRVVVSAAVLFPTMH